MTTYKASIAFSGIYDWGTGYNSHEKYEAWKKFFKDFNEKKHIFWHHVHKDSIGGTDYIVSVHGGCMVHPMGFDVIISNAMSTEDYVMKELHRICKDICEACGGSYHIGFSEYRRVDK